MRRCASHIQAAAAGLVFGLAAANGAKAESHAVLCAGAPTVIDTLDAVRDYADEVVRLQQGLTPDRSTLRPFGHEQKAVTEHAQAQRQRLAAAYSLMKVGKVDLFRSVVAEISDAMRSAQDRATLTDSSADWRDYAIGLEAAGVALIYSAAALGVVRTDVIERLQEQLLEAKRYTSRPEGRCGSRTGLALSALQRKLEAE